MATLIIFMYNCSCPFRGAFIIQKQKTGSIFIFQIAFLEIVISFDERSIYVYGRRERRSYLPDTRIRRASFFAFSSSLVVEHLYASENDGEKTLSRDRKMIRLYSIGLKY
jgi:hypothetical protein